MNLEYAMDVDENIKPEVLEAGVSEADRQYLRVRQDLSGR